MKRTLLEIACGLAALVLMVSFHHQIAKLEQHNQDVQKLEAKVDAAVAAAGSRSELTEMRQQLLTQMEARLKGLDARLQQATAGSEVANKLQDEFERAQRDAARLRQDVSTDSQRTRALVDAYIDEVRSKERNADLRISEQQNAITNLAGTVLKNPQTMTRGMLLPTVQLNGDDTVGSGTLVFSDTNPKTDKVESYVLTSYHVVRNILADTPKAQKEGIDITVYLGKEKLTIKGRMIANQPRIDAALLKLETEKKLPCVANVYPPHGADPVKVWDAVCAVGCPLGNDPVPSHGEVSSLSNDLNGSNYWMINAPTYFGNSGGGVYMADTQQLIGVFSKIYTHGKGTPVVVPHMGLCTPMPAVHEWLEQEGLDHLLRSEQVQRVDLTNLASPPPAPPR